MTETIPSKELIGKDARLIVHKKPCKVVSHGHEPLTETTTGILTRFIKMPGGPIGFMETEEGKKICFDAGFDISSGKIEIELI